MWIFFEKKVKNNNKKGVQMITGYVRKINKNIISRELAVTLLAKSISNLADLLVAGPVPFGV